MKSVTGTARGMAVAALVFTTLALMDGTATQLLHSWADASISDPLSDEMVKLLDAGLWEVCATDRLMDIAEIPTRCYAVNGTDLVYVKGASLGSLLLGLLAWIAIIGAFTSTASQLLAATFSFLQCAAMLGATGRFTNLVSTHDGLSFLPNLKGTPILLIDDFGPTVSYGYAFYFAWSSAGLALISTLFMAFAACVSARAKQAPNQYQLVEVLKPNEPTPPGIDQA
ncbi:uncharacterized protein LOC135812921 [Sycon ciliatum]|uniref:uncharacterized protein LOC135812921 n=1 Tax=Sycon ciliatum TaxID=27933 RepID=UPI0031F61DC9